MEKGTNRFLFFMKKNRFYLRMIHHHPDRIIFPHRLI